jgi:hypothetical protein
MKIEQPLSPIGKLSLPLRSILVTVVILFWYFLSGFSYKVLGLVLSMLFSLAEFCWYSMTIEKGDGEVEFKPFDPNCRKGHTVLYIKLDYSTIFRKSFNITCYYRLLSYFDSKLIGEIINKSSCNLGCGDYTRVRFKLFSYILMALYGYNPAWYYCGKWSFFDGNIQFNYYTHWLIAGLFFEFFYNATNYIIS